MNRRLPPKIIMIIASIVGRNIRKTDLQYKVKHKSWFRRNHTRLNDREATIGVIIGFIIMMVLDDISD